MSTLQINSIRTLLKQVDKEFKNISQPIFNEIKGVRGAPVRHVYMNAIVWYLSKFTKNKNIKILEIGSYVGSSLFTWEESALKYIKGNTIIYSIDPLESFIDDNYEGGDLSQIGDMEEGVKYDFAYNVLRHNMKLLSNKNIHFRTYSNDILPILRDESFDLIYIDGNHGYKAVLEDLKEAKRLIKNNGIICGDDLELQGDQIDLEFARANKHIDFIQDPNVKSGYHPGVTLAVWDTFEEVSSWAGFWAIQANNDNTFNKNISLIDAPINIPAHFSDELTEQISKEIEKTVYREEHEKYYK